MRSSQAAGGAVELKGRLKSAKRRRAADRAKGSAQRQVALDEQRKRMEHEQQQQTQQAQQQCEHEIAASSLQVATRVAAAAAAARANGDKESEGAESTPAQLVHRPIESCSGMSASTSRAACRLVMADEPAPASRAEQSEEDENDHEELEAERPLIKSQQNLPTSSFIGATLHKAHSMVQMKLAPLQAASQLELATGQLSGCKPSPCGSSGACSASNSSSSSLLESSRRSSSLYAVEMGANLIKCDTHSSKPNNNNNNNNNNHHSRVKNQVINRNASLDQLLNGAAAAQDRKSTNSKVGPHESCDYLSGLAEGAKQPNKMERTISQSMLEFDASIGVNEQFQLYWKELTFSYEPSWALRRLAPGPKQPRQRVLNQLSGSIRSNQLVAIIGPSGCGKTTLLQFLAGNNANERARLCIRGIDEPKVAFIGQDDSLLPGLTARETLMYASRLQCNTANFDHAAHIQPILSELGLCECADRNVSKLSGGQAKRVTIAQELLYPTNLLILDEVTSGLDATTSYSIVRLLKYLVSDSSYPMSIVMSIHQPSARLFSVFDKVYVMSEGCCLYEGSCNLAQINEHLGRFQLECPKFHNIADYLIELASSSAPEEPPNSAASLFRASGGGGGVDKAALAEGGDASAIKERMVEFQRKQSLFLMDSEARQLFRGAQLEEGAISSKLNGHPNKGIESQEYEQAEWQLDYSLYEAIDRARARRQRPFWSHLKIHFGRSLLRIRRSYILTWLQLLTYIVLGFQLASFYGPDIGKLSGCPRLPANLMNYILAPGSVHDNSNEDDELTLEIRRIQENMNFLLVAVLTATFAALEITVITFPLEAKTIKREWRNGWYRVSSYFMGRTLADLPFQVCFVLVFCLLIYSMTGQVGLDSWRFGAFALCVLMTAFLAQSFGFIFGALFMNNLPAAVFTAPLAIFPTLLFSGFFARVSQVPYFWRPLTYVSHFRYTFDALLVTLYGFDRCQCDQEQLTNYHAGLANQTSSMREMFHLLFGASDCLSAASAASSGSQDPAGNAEAHSAGVTTQSDIADAISHEDLAAIHAGNSSLAGQLVSMIRTEAASTTPTPPSGHAPLRALAPSVSASASAGFKQLEDLLVESLFQQMSASGVPASTSGLEFTHNNSSAGALNDTLAFATATTTTTAPTPAGEPHEEPSAMDKLANRFATRLTGMLNKQSNFGHPMPTECVKFNSYLVTEFNLTDDDLLFGLLMLLFGVLLTRLLCNLILHFTIASRVR